MKTRFKKLFFIFILLLPLHVANAAEEFIIEDIRVEGLERVTPGLSLIHI